MRKTHFDPLRKACHRQRIRFFYNKDAAGCYTAYLWKPGCPVRSSSADFLQAQHILHESTRFGPKPPLVRATPRPRGMIPHQGRLHRRLPRGLNLLLFGVATGGTASKIQEVSLRGNTS